MEYGLIANITQYADNKSIEIQKVQASNETSQVSSKNQLEQLQQEAIAKEKEVSAAKKTEAKSSSNYEVVLSNTNFGFNDESRDFYVKVQRGTAENQYPTENMMRLKAYMMSLDSAS